MKYENGEPLKVGDVFTDGDEGRTDIRLQNRAKVVYVDKYILVWFPLNDFTRHVSNKDKPVISNVWVLTAIPKKVKLSDLTKEERVMYDSSDFILNYIL